MEVLFFYIVGLGGITMAAICFNVILNLFGKEK
jgi:hypothetical protein